MTPSTQDRVLVLAPTAGDAEITQSILGEARLHCHLCASAAELCASLSEGGGAILMTEEMLVRDDATALIAEIRRQPPWSDIPVLVLSGSRAAPSLVVKAAELGNVTILERPVHLTNLVSAVKTAIRARRRQYQIRDQLIALESAEEQLREADRRKDEFLAILAHELRNPLAPARNAAGFLKIQGSVEPAIRRAADMIERQIAQMSRLIDDLLDVSRISRGQLELRRERFDLAEVVDATVEACRHEIHARQHALRVSMPPERVGLHADRERLIQILSNLVTNAAKYTPEGGHLEVTGRVHGETLELSVSDDGIGIPPEKQAEIFELFAQVDRSFDRQGGLGIGLTLVQQLVQLHGGTIEARSDGVGRGSTFVVRLPIVSTATEAASARRPVAPPERVARRILAADDNRDAAESLAMLLKLDGHDVRIAFDGDSAISAAGEFLPDVALLDIAMPKRDGFQVARHIRAQPWGRDILLVALTGWGQDGDRARARAAGFDAHLVKPVDPGALNEVLSGRGRALRA